VTVVPVTIILRLIAYASGFLFHASLVFRPEAMSRHPFAGEELNICRQGLVQEPPLAIAASNPKHLLPSQALLRVVWRIG
jgi:hypothetical protein